MATNKKFAIRRSIEIDTAHRVPDHGSKCFNLHGHRYKIEAVCTGDVIEAGEQTGMVMDFGFLKHVMMSAIYDPCDHGLVLFQDDPIINTIAIDVGHGVKLLKLPCVPTAENLAEYWFNCVEDGIELFFMSWEAARRPDPLPKLEQIRVWETPNCVAWYPHVDPFAEPLIVHELGIES